MEEHLFAVVQVLLFLFIKKKKKKDRKVKKPFISVLENNRESLQFQMMKLLMLNPWLVNGFLSFGHKKIFSTELENRPFFFFWDS